MSVDRQTSNMSVDRQTSNMSVVIDYTEFGLD